MTFYITQELHSIYLLCLILISVNKLHIYDWSDWSHTLYTTQYKWIKEIEIFVRNKYHFLYNFKV